MRCLSLMVVFAIVALSTAAPDPKKYKPETKAKAANASLTDDERKFLREVEEKFGIKADVPINDNDDKESVDKPVIKAPFPAVIAIEIVNDTDSVAKSGKGKRTIDANLGYGYRTNNGYAYSYFGKSAQDKGKFMIYPYSQHDIPPANPHAHSTVVDIQPSRAFELVPVKQENGGYDYKKPETEFKSGQTHQSRPQTYQEDVSQTLYTTYNGEQFSGLQEQFPKLMSNYFVDPTQLLRNPQYQSVGLTQAHLKPHENHLDQRVVPVLVLRIPSSYLKNPSAELYANLPQNYPHSNHLNTVNLQELVNRYFKKMGYPFAPQIMSYNSGTSQHSGYSQTQVQAQPAVPNYENHYSQPYVRPTYTQSDYSGVQYSAVKPVMAKYPSQNYYKHQYYTVPTQTQTRYQQPQQQYQYQYQYVPQTAAKQQQSYYVQEQYEAPTHTDSGANSGAAYETSYASQEEPQQQTAQEYESANLAQQYASIHDVSSEQDATEPTPAHEAPKQELEYSVAQTEGQTADVQTYGQEEAKAPETQSYYTHSQPAAQKETIAIYAKTPSQNYQTYSSNPHTGASQSYFYQKQINDDSASKTIVISNSYPSGRLPSSYQYSTPQPETQQSVSYVTPMPYSAAKYQSQYRVMVPQTVLKSEKVAYVNSHSIPMHYLSVMQQHNPENEYTVSRDSTVAVGTQKPPSYPKNYHSSLKRMVKSDKTESVKAKTSGAEKKSQ